MEQRTPPWDHSSLPSQDRGHRERILSARELVTGIISGLVASFVVAMFTINAQANLDDRREEKADRRENARFVRQLALDGKAAEGSFQGMDLSGTNLSGLNLKRADLSDADLSETNLSHADLSEATLDGANLSGSTLVDMELSGATLLGANLSGAHLAGVRAGMLPSDRFGFDVRTDFTGADFSQASLIGVKLSGADLSRVDFSYAVLEEGTIFSETTIFEMTTFHGADLSEAELPWRWEHPLLPPVDTFVFANAVKDPLCYDETTQWPALADAETIDDGTCPRRLVRDRQDPSQYRLWRPDN